MELKVKESFSVEAPFERVWEFLSKPELMLGCIPGAKVKEVKEDGSFSAEVKVKLGAITLNFTGNMRYEELGKEEGRMKLTGEGKDKGGAGKAKAIIESEVVQEGDTIRVNVLAKVNLTGRILQYGRGMFEQVAKEYFAQFSKCATEYLSQFKEEEKKSHEEVSTNHKETREEVPKMPQAKEISMFALLVRAFLRWVSSLFRRG